MCVFCGCSSLLLPGIVWATIAGVSLHKGPQAGLLIGRAGELARLDEALEEFGSGQPRAVEIVGDPGIGKTRLLGELISGAERRGVRVVSSWAREPDRGVPFAMFADAIGGQLAEVLYAGGAPGMVAGVVQLNVLIPPGSASGAAVPVTMTVGGQSSPLGTTIAVQ